MSFGTPAPAVPAEPTEPVEQVAPVEPAAPAEPAALHESWQRALDDSGIPDLLRREDGPLMQQIRRQESEANKRIEELSAQRAPEPWQQLISQAGDDISPADLVNSYNATSQIRENPFAFVDSLVKQVGEMVTSGQLSAPEGWAVRYQAALGQGATQAQAQQIADAGNGFVSPEDDDPRIAELQQWKTAQEQREQQRLEAEQEAQQEAADDEYAERFLGFLDTALVTAGFAADAAGLDEGTRAMVSSVAGQLIEAADGDIDFDQAIPMAIQQVTGMITQRGGQVAARPAVPATPQLPVGGGSNVLPAPAGGFPTKEARLAAMVAAGQAALHA